MKNKVDERIENLRKIMLMEIGGNVDKLSSSEYHQKRKQLNEELIAILIGAEFKDGQKLVMKYSLPTKKQLNTIIVMMNTFIDTVENPFLMKIMNPETAEKSDNEEDNEDDIDIPDRDDDYELKNSGYNITMRDKVSKKDMKNIIFGLEGENPITNYYLNMNDIMILAAMGETLRKKIIRNRCIIIGGVTFAIAAGVTTGLLIYNHKKKEKEEDVQIDSESEIPEIEYDDPELPEITDADVIIDTESPNLI